MKEWKNSTAKSTSTDGEWQRQFGRGRILICSTSAATKVEGDLSVILVDPMVKAFLAAEGITRSSDLFRGLLRRWGSLYRLERQQVWQRLPPATLAQYVYAWRRCVINHVPEEANERHRTIHFQSNGPLELPLSGSSFVGSL
jgi:hypothetical protein